MELLALTAQAILCILSVVVATLPARSALPSARFESIERPVPRTSREWRTLGRETGPSSRLDHAPRDIWRVSYTMKIAKYRSGWLRIGQPRTLRPAETWETGVEHVVVIGWLAWRCTREKEREREREGARFANGRFSMKLSAPLQPSIQFAGACYYFSACYSADYSRNRCEY